MFITFYRRGISAKKIKQFLKFPHPNPKIRLLDNAVSAIAIIFPLTSIPQVLEIWNKKSSENVSFASWISWSILNFILLIYAFIHGDLKLKILFGFSFLIDFVVAVEIIIFN